MRAQSQLHRFAKETTQTATRTEIIVPALRITLYPPCRDGRTLKTESCTLRQKSRMRTNGSTPFTVGQLISAGQNYTKYIVPWYTCMNVQKIQETFETISTSWQIVLQMETGRISLTRAGLAGLSIAFLSLPCFRQCFCPFSSFSTWAACE